jgi:hypothetical protein
MSWRAKRARNQRREFSDIRQPTVDLPVMQEIEHRAT